MDAYTVLAADDSMTKISVQTDKMYQNDDVSRNRDEVRRTIRNAITIAEREYPNPVIRVVMHPTIHELLADSKSVVNNPQLTSVDGYDVIQSEYTLLSIVVCGVEAKDLYRNRMNTTTQNI